MYKKLIVIGLVLVINGCFVNAATVVEANKDIQVLGEQKMLIESLKKFVDDKPEAADEMEYVIQKKEDANRKKMNDMLEKMATDTSGNVKADEPISGGALDYVTRKLNLALVYFYEAKYWLTIDECNNVIKVDSKNPMAWTRRGSGYYMLGQYEQAKTDWQIALKLNPKKSDRVDLEKFLVKADSLIAQEKD